MSAVTSINIIDDTCNQPWNVQVAPFPVADQVFYVGNKWVGAYLIDTGDGLILLDTTTAETAYQLIDSIYQLGRNPRDIKMILLTHAHVDHYGAARILKELSGAQIWMSEEDAAFHKTEGARELGGLTTTFRDYGVEADRFYRYEQPIRLGNVSIDVRLTPGHTPGVVSFFIHVPDAARGSLTLAMHGGVGVLTLRDESLKRAGLDSSLRRRFIRDCMDMKKIPVDICLPSHPAHHPPFQEAAGKSWENGNPFISSTAWASFLDSRRSFAEELEPQSKAGE